ncbi:MAG: hypothetical protein Q4A24_03070 [Akkermansia sp.]|nr:hypothetical protein [Akkermansia sp.]
MRGNILKKLLRTDSLLVTLVVVLATIFAGIYGKGGSPFFSGGVLEAEAPPVAEFGAVDAQSSVLSECAESDDVVNRNLAAMPKAASAESVRFLMLNAHNYFVKGEKQRSRYKLSIKKEPSCEAVADVIASAAPEIVGLIEIGGPMALEDLRTRLRRRGLEYPYTKVLAREGEDRALALLSVHPIVQDHSRAECKLLGNQRQTMLRGILDVTVKVQGSRYFRIVGAHLKSRVADDPAAATARRSKEARTLAMYIQHITRKQPKMPIVVYGDWNDGPGDSSLRILTQGVSEDAALTRVKALDSRGAAWTLCYEPAQEYYTFDQIFVNSVLRSRRGRKCEAGIVDCPAAEAASDHRAVWCELR